MKRVFAVLPAFLFLCTVAVAAPRTYQLKFSDLPAGAPDPAAWVVGETEGTLTHADVQAALALKEDPVIAWLVANKVCDGAAQRCPFLVHYQMNDSDSKDPESTVVVRYAFRGADGTTIEGFSLSPSRHSAYHFWTRRGTGAWTESTDKKDLETQLIFTSNLVEFMGFLANGHVLTFTP